MFRYNGFNYSNKLVDMAYQLLKDAGHVRDRPSWSLCPELGIDADIQVIMMTETLEEHRQTLVVSGFCKGSEWAARHYLDYLYATELVPGYLWVPDVEALRAAIDIYFSREWELLATQAEREQESLMVFLENFKAQPHRHPYLYALCRMLEDSDGVSGTWRDVTTQIVDLGYMKEANGRSMSSSLNGLMRVMPGMMPALGIDVLKLKGGPYVTTYPNFNADGWLTTVLQPQ